MAGGALTGMGRDWEDTARDWIAWVREPGLDSYWRYREEFFSLVPEPGTATLDLACGEGRVARDLVGRGHTVTGVDASPTMIEAASASDPDSRYLVADAADLPFEEGAFDLVVAYNVFMDVDDLSGSVVQASRVLVSGGRLVLSIVHPVTNAGRLVGDGPDAHMVLDGQYFARRRFEERVERAGLRMRFSGWDRPLGDYTRALEDAGLFIEALREPVAISRAGTAYRFPFHLWIRAVRPA